MSTMAGTLALPDGTARNAGRPDAQRMVRVSTSAMLGFHLRLAALRIPVAFEIADQRRAEMTMGLLARVDGKVRAEGVERLLRHAQGAPVARRAHHAGIGQSRHDAIERRIHLLGRNDLVAHKPAFRAVAFEPALVENGLPRNAVAG